VNHNPDGRQAARSGWQLRHIGLLLGVLAFAVLRLLPPPAGMPPEAWAVAALVILMAIFWFTEALPIAATAMLPFVVLPLLGIASTREVASQYYSPIIFLVLGGAIVAVAVEKYGLHRRIALGLAARSPASLAGVLAAFMAATALISTLISNTATTLIMMPVAIALLAALPGVVGEDAERRFAPVLILGVAYAANIGGLATLVASPTNAIAAGIIERSLGLRITFLDWALFGVPLAIVSLPIAIGALMMVGRVANAPLDPRPLLDAIGRPGPLTGPQRRLIPLLGLLLFGWLVLPFLKAPLGLEAVDDAMVAIIVALLLFIVPAGRGEGPILAWSDTKRVPWDVLLLFGGGLALATFIADSGLADWLGTQLSGFAQLPPWALAMIAVAIMLLVTEFASNVATASAFMPVVAAVAMETGVNPLPLMMAAALAPTWGFMMPAGTGPNAIAFSTGRVPIRQMIGTGFLLDLAGIPLIVGTCFIVAALIG
jgi:sodium-dependent dicarboxylate transporter 2/3/5